MIRLIIYLFTMAMSAIVIATLVHEHHTVIASLVALNACTGAAAFAYAHYLQTKESYSLALKMRKS